MFVPFLQEQSENGAVPQEQRTHEQRLSLYRERWPYEWESKENRCRSGLRRRQLPEAQMTSFFGDISRCQRIDRFDLSRRIFGRNLASNLQNGRKCREEERPLVRLIFEAPASEFQLCAVMR